MAGITSRISNVASRETDYSTMAIWKVVPLLIVLFISGLLLGFTPLTSIQGAIGGRMGYLIAPLVSVVVVYLGYRVFTALLGRPLSYFNVRGPDRAVARWVAVGGAIPLAVYVLNVVGRDPSFEFRSAGVVLVGTIVLVAAAESLFFSVFEEYLFRGFLLTIIAERWNWGLGIVVTSAVFGWAHNAATASSAGTWLVMGSSALAGLVMALVVYRTRNVWHAVGFHFGWNLISSPLLVAFLPANLQANEPLVGIAFREASFLWDGSGDVLPGATPISIVLLVALVLALLADIVRSDESDSNPPTAPAES